MPPSKTVVLVHPHRDPGVYHTGRELLRKYLSQTHRALVVLDREWDGAPSSDAAVLQELIEKGLREDWGESARCVCIDPEIEQWIWSERPVLSSTARHSARLVPLIFLAAKGALTSAHPEIGSHKSAH